MSADSFNWLEVVPGENGPKLTLSNTRTDFDIGRMRVRLNNLFNGDKFLGKFNYANREAAFWGIKYF